MRVTITTAEDFCAELSSEAKAGRIWQKQVRTRVDRAPEQKEAVSFAVVLWATAAIQTPDGDYVMEYGEDCGSDDPDQTPNNAGTYAARQRIDMIREVAKNYGLECRAGKFEQF